MKRAKITVQTACCLEFGNKLLLCALKNKKPEFEFMGYILRR